MAAIRSAEHASTRQAARGPGRRLAEEIVPAPAQGLQRLQRGFGLGGADVGQLAAQLGAAPRRILWQREAEAFGEDLERARTSALALQVGSETGLVEHADGARELPQRREDRLRAGEQPSLALARRGGLLCGRPEPAPPPG